MSLAYGIVCIAALIQLGVCIAIDRNKEIWLLLMFVSVFVCDLGYFLLSVSETLDQALMANRIAYLGSVFLPFFMLMMILNLCRIHCRNWFCAVLFWVGIIVFGIAASPGYLTVYYKTASIEMVDGVTMLVREYGPLHSLYYLYLFLYFGGMLCVVGYSIAKKQTLSYIHGGFLLAAVLVSMAVWLAEQFCPVGLNFCRYPTYSPKT